VSPDVTNARRSSGRFFSAPSLNRLRHYNRGWLRPDIIAGITVAAYLIPQTMAYAEIAGLSPVVGLWAMIPPILIYAVLGSSPQLSVGPESTTAVMTATAVAPIAAGNGSDYAALCAAMAIMVGVICVIGFLGRLGFVANLLSRPILVGYLAGVALIMISGQLGKVTGLDVEGDSFIAEVTDWLSQLGDLHRPTTLLSIGVLIMLFGLAALAPKWPGPLIAVVVSVIVVAVFDLQDEGVSVVGQIPSGLPTPKVPDVAWADLRDLLPAALGIALVGYSDNVLTARGFASKTKTRVDANQELLALGTSNLGNGFFQAFPISSSGSRTTIGASIGSRSQMFSLVALVAIVLVLFFFSGLLEQFPNAALGALVIWAATRLIDWGEFRTLFRFRKTEFLLAIATTAGVVLSDILVGVVLAIVLSVTDLIARIARPHDAVLGKVPEMSGYHDIEDYPEAETMPGLLVYRYDAPLFFANADDFRDSLMEEVENSDDTCRWVVLQCEAIGRIDSTATQVLRETINELHGDGILVGMTELKWDLADQLRRIGILDIVGDENVYTTIDDAITAYRTSTPTS